MTDFCHLSFGPCSLAKQCVLSHPRHLALYKRSISLDLLTRCCRLILIGDLLHQSLLKLNSP